MEDILIAKIKEVMNELKEGLMKDHISDDHKNVLVGKLIVLIELLENKKED